MTNLPNSEQSGDLDNINVTRAEFRSDIGVFLEYVAQALGGITGNYTPQAIDPQAVLLQGTPQLEPGATPPDASRDDRIPSTSWVQDHGRYVNSTEPASPADGMLWVDTSGSYYQLSAYNSAETRWDTLSGVPAGTRMLFQQTAAPVGWTKDATNDNMALRVVSGSVSTVTSEQPFTTAFNVKGVTGNVDQTVLTVSQMPVHSHGISDPGHSHTCSVSDPGHAHLISIGVRPNSSAGGGGNNEIIGGTLGTQGSVTGISASANSNSTSVTAQNNGSGLGHNHNFSGGSVDIAVNYVDVIVAEKD